ncbi:MAG TPA: hypothetical protein VFA21_05475 [Pyrinomonadaceae bacterium]|nr:hypothetical protein [Pyrinomonadaceae bacterium]
MAEERTLGAARAPESSDDTDATKAELQRRMEEARESISQTVTEIKDTVVNQYQQVRETISDTLDWREQYKRHTLPFTIGAVGVGFLVGYTVMGAFKSDGDDYDEEDGAFDRIESGFDRMQPARSYAASPILGQAHAPAAYQRASSEGEEDYAAGVGQQSEAAPRPSYSSGYTAPTAPPAPQQAADEEEEEEDKGPGLFSRFKETKAYDMLTDELSTIGERAVEELSKTAQTVIVPLLLNKLKSLIGVDLTQQQQGGQRTARAQAGTPSSAGAQQAGAQGGPTGASSSTGTSGTTGAGGPSANAATGGAGQS